MAAFAKGAKADLAEGMKVEDAKADSVEAVSEEIEDLAKNMKQHALSAARSARFLLNQKETGLFTARNVSGTEGLKETDSDSMEKRYFKAFFSFINIILSRSPYLIDIYL